jgi:hypothetical protein
VKTVTDSTNNRYGRTRRFARHKRRAAQADSHRYDRQASNDRYAPNVEQKADFPAFSGRASALFDMSNAGGKARLFASANCQQAMPLRAAAVLVLRWRRRRKV